MAYNIKVGSKWQDRGSGAIGEVLALGPDGKIQISSTSAQGYRIMNPGSLRSNFKELTAQEAKTVQQPPAETVKTPDFSNVEKHITGKVNKGMLKTPKPVPDAQKPARPATEGRASIGRVKLADGKVIPASTFITEVCGKAKEHTYNVDSAIRWLLKKGGDLLKERKSTIVYGEPITK